MAVEQQVCAHVAAVESAALVNPLKVEMAGKGRWAQISLYVTGSPPIGAFALIDYDIRVFRLHYSYIIVNGTGHTVGI